MRVSQAHRPHRLRAARAPVLLASALLFLSVPMVPAPAADDLRRCAAGIACPQGLTPAEAKRQIEQGHAASKPEGRAAVRRPVR